MNIAQNYVKITITLTILDLKNGNENQPMTDGFRIVGF